MSMGALLCGSRRRAAGTGAGGAFLPTDLSGLALWLDADDASSITEATSNQVSQWDDKSGNARHFSQATSGDQPATNVTAQNGRNVIDFDGVSEVLYRTSTFIHGLGPMSVFIVISATAEDNMWVLSESSTLSNTQLFGVFIMQSGAHNDKQAAFYRDDANNTDIDQTSFANGALYDNSFNIGLVTDSGTVHKTFVDGGPQEHSLNYTRGTYALNRVSIGALVRAAVSNWAAFSIGEIIIYDSVLSDADLNQVGNYLNGKWAAPWTDI